MVSDIFEYRRQERGPKNYIALGLAGAVLYFGWAQGWSLVAVLLCGPFLGYILARLVMNDAEGFRLTETSLEYYRLTDEQSLDWHEINGVTITGDGLGGAACLIHCADGRSESLPATAQFSPERLSQEFRLRGIPVWRTQSLRPSLGEPQLQ
ncbi:MAG: hypothetical protein WAT77_00280 [Paracoccaceae bacterium]